MRPPRPVTPERRALVAELHTALLAAHLGGQLTRSDYRKILGIVGEL